MLYRNEGIHTTAPFSVAAEQCKQQQHFHSRAMHCQLCECVFVCVLLTASVCTHRQAGIRAVCNQSLSQSLSQLLASCSPSLSHCSLPHPHRLSCPPPSPQAARLEGEVAQSAGPKEFAEMWSKKAPSNMDMPQLPSQQLEKKADSMKTQGDLFPVNMCTPHSVIADAKQVRGRLTRSTRTLASVFVCLCVRCVHTHTCTADWMTASQLGVLSSLRCGSAQEGSTCLHPSSVHSLASVHVCPCTHVQHQLCVGLREMGSTCLHVSHQLRVALASVFACVFVRACTPTCVIACCVIVCW